MSVIRNVLIAGLGFVAMKMVKRMVENAQKQQVAVKAKSDAKAMKVQNLQLDPVTGVYRPQA